jgi:hypothetical protein
MGRTIQHVRSAPTMQLEQVNLFEVPGHLPDTKRLSEVGGIVLIYHETTIDIDQPQRILVLVGDRVNAHLF